MTNPQLDELYRRLETVRAADRRRLKKRRRIKQKLKKRPKLQPVRAKNLMRKSLKKNPLQRKLFRVF